MLWSEQVPETGERRRAGQSIDTTWMPATLQTRHTQIRTYTHTYIRTHYPCVQHQYTTVSPNIRPLSSAHMTLARLSKCSMYIHMYVCLYGRTNNMGLTSFIATCSLLYKFFPAMVKGTRKWLLYLTMYQIGKVAT